MYTSMCITDEVTTRDSWLSSLDENEQRVADLSQFAHLNVSEKSMESENKRSDKAYVTFKGHDRVLKKGNLYEKTMPNSESDNAGVIGTKDSFDHYQSTNMKCLSKNVEAPKVIPVANSNQDSASADGCGVPSDACKENVLDSGKM